MTISHAFALIMTIGGILLITQPKFLFGKSKSLLAKELNMSNCSLELVYPKISQIEDARFIIEKLETWVSLIFHGFSGFIEEKVSLNVLLKLIQQKRWNSSLFNEFKEFKFTHISHSSAVHSNARTLSYSRPFSSISFLLFLFYFSFSSS